VTAGETEEPAEPAPPRIGFARLRRIVLVVAGLLLVALIVLWSQRKQIARGYADRYLATHGVTGRYRIADLGFNRQRLTDVVLGDPAHPDLVADWIEVETSVGTGGVGLTGVRGGHVRLRARLVDGRVSLGTLDRLIPKSGGAGTFALPAIRLDLEDARVRLETPYGIVGAKVSGRGRLDDGFDGRVAAATNRLSQAGCTLADGAVALTVTTRNGRPTLSGPVRAGSIACNGVAAARPAATIKATLGKGFDRWSGSVRLAADAVRGGGFYRLATRHQRHGGPAQRHGGVARCVRSHAWVRGQFHGRG
jgi:hypothetical protein